KGDKRSDMMKIATKKGDVRVCACFAATQLLRNVHSAEHCQRAPLVKKDALSDDVLGFDYKIVYGAQKRV
ncbi:hypothetical protein, partial [Flagellimonas marinaquae]